MLKKKATTQTELLLRYSRALQSLWEDSPCTEALLWAGISNVVIAHGDPNPIVRGNGTSVLENAGIKVEMGYWKMKLLTK